METEKRKQGTTSVGLKREGEREVDSSLCLFTTKTKHKVNRILMIALVRPVPWFLFCLTQSCYDSAHILSQYRSGYFLFLSPVSCIRVSLSNSASSPPACVDTDTSHVTRDHVIMTFSQCLSGLSVFSRAQSVCWLCNALTTWKQSNERSD